MTKDLAVFSEDSYRPYGEAWRWRMGGYLLLLGVASCTTWGMVSLGIAAYRAF